MPKLDGTGPRGQGAGTGWGMGPCGAGMGRGRCVGGRGGGFGWRRFWGYCPGVVPTEKEERKLLEEEVGFLEDELKALKTRLAEIKK